MQDDDTGRDTGPDTTIPADTAREEVARSEPAKAPLPDPAGLAHSLSPVDLPEPDQPLPKPLAWTFTVIGTACLFLALFNAGAVRSWSYELKPTPTNQRIISAAEGWYDTTASVGLEGPTEAMRGGWKALQSLRFPGQAPAQTETGPDA